MSSPTVYKWKRGITSVVGFVCNPVKKFTRAFLNELGDLPSVLWFPVSFLLILVMLFFWLFSLIVFEALSNDLTSEYVQNKLRTHDKTCVLSVLEKNKDDKGVMTEYTFDLLVGKCQERAENANTMEQIIKDVK